MNPVNLVNRTSEFGHDVISSDNIRDYKNIFIVPLIILAICITLLNSAVILIYKRMHFNQKTVSNYLLFSTAVSDLYIGGVTWYEFVVHYSSRDFYHVIHVLYKGLLEYSYILSLGNLFLCAIERYASVCMPSYHRSHVTKSRVLIGTCVVWLVSVIPPVALLTLLFTINDVVTQSNAMRWYSFTFDGVMLMLICSSVSVLLVTLKTARQLVRPKQNKQRKITATATLDEKTLIHQQQIIDAKHKKEFRLVLIFVIMITTYVVTYLPVTVGRILYDVGILSSLNRFDGVVLLSLCQTLYKSSALFNPVLTFTLREDFRSVFTTWLLRNGFGKKKRTGSDSSQHQSSSDSDRQRYSHTTYV